MPLCLDFRAVERAGGDSDAMTARLESERERHIGMQIAE